MVDLIRPILEFDGPIIYVDSIEQSNKICDELLLDSQLTEVGLDTEWPVTYRPGSQAKTAVLQLSTREKCLIFHLSAMESFPPALLRLLVATRITKVGLNIEGDIWKLGIDYEIPAQHINRLCKLNMSPCSYAIQVFFLILRCQRCWAACQLRFKFSPKMES